MHLFILVVPVWVILWVLYLLILIQRCDCKLFHACLRWKMLCCCCMILKMTVVLCIFVKCCCTKSLSARAQWSFSKYFIFSVSKCFSHSLCNTVRWGSGAVLFFILCISNVFRSPYLCCEALWQWTVTKKLATPAAWVFLRGCSGASSISILRKRDHIDIIPVFHNSFNVCICRIDKYRHESGSFFLFFLCLHPSTAFTLFQQS